MKTKTIQIPTEIADMLSKIAKREDRSESSVIRNALRFFFENYGNTKNTPKKESK